MNEHSDAPPPGPERDRLIEDLVRAGRYQHFAFLWRLIRAALGRLKTSAKGS